MHGETIKKDCVIVCSAPVKLSVILYQNLFNECTTNMSQTERRTCVNQTYPQHARKLQIILNYTVLSCFLFTLHNLHYSENVLGYIVLRNNEQRTLFSLVTGLLKSYQV